MNNLLKVGLIAGALSFGVIVFAQLNPFDIEFPIPELGNCGSVDECKSYCDVPDNQRVCFEWAKARGFVEERPKPRLPEEGPGGCRGREECDAYCRQPDHGEECLNFGVEHGLIPPEEARRIREEMNKTGPGGCNSREECDAFCSNPDNGEVCLQFAVEEGMITQEEADYLIQRMRMHEMGPPGPGPGPGEPGPRPEGPDIDEDRIRELMESDDFVGPGGCTTMDTCDAYCSQSENDEECFNYALEHGLIPPEEAEKFRRMLEMGGPGGCQGPAECDVFCGQPENQETCMQFAIDNELVPPEEIEHMQKMMEIMKEGGPGGCQGQLECDAYCNQPEHGEECFQFAKTHGLIPPEELQMIEREMEIMMKLERADVAGPGGCMSREECDAFCRQPENFEECMMFAGDQGMRDDTEMERKIMELRQMEGEPFFMPPPPDGMMPPPPDGMMPPPPDGMMPPDEFFQEKCDFNGDGRVDDFEKQRCMTDSTMPVGETGTIPLRCDFNGDGVIDENERYKCSESFGTYESLQPPPVEYESLQVPDVYMPPPEEFVPRETEGYKPPPENYMPPPEESTTSPVLPTVSIVWWPFIAAL